MTNVTDFGAFVDRGVHQDRLVHVSRIADRFVRDPGEVLRVGQTVRASRCSTWTWSTAASRSVSDSRTVPAYACPETQAAKTICRIVRERMTLRVDAGIIPPSVRGGCPERRRSPPAWEAQRDIGDGV